MLLDVLGKMAVSDALHGRVATVPLLIILNRFADENSIIDFVEQYCKLALTLFINVEKRAHAGDTGASEQTGKQARKGGLDVGEIRRTLILEALAKIIHLEHGSFNAVIRPLVGSAASEFAAIFRSEHPGLLALVRYFEGDEPPDVSGERRLFQQGSGRDLKLPNINARTSLHFLFDLFVCCCLLLFCDKQVPCVYIV